MKTGFRQCMAWLHTWSGLLLGWLLFAIFLTGTAAYFREEIDYWMQPELHVSVPGDRMLELALERLRTVAPTAETWSISLPDERSRTIGLSWREPGQSGGRRRGPSETLDAGTGETLHPRQTAGGNFLYRFHFELHGLPRGWARLIVGIATLAMFVAILSGVVTHKKIFADFFTFRPGKGQRSWLDAHAATAVLALPYHLMITYSGLLLFMATLIPWNVPERGGRTHRADPPTAAAEPASRDAGHRMNAGQLASMTLDAERRWGLSVGQITISRPDRVGTTVEMAPIRNSRLSAHSGSGRAGVERLRYEGASGRLERASDGPPVSGAQATVNALGSLHRARFAAPGLRWLFFLSGVAGTAMVGTGLVLWTVKRTRRDAPSWGGKLVLVLNVAGVAGLICAVTGFFWANRLIPASLPGRADGEITVFFAVWAISVLHAVLRPIKRAWIEQFGLAGLMLATLPLLDVATSSQSLAASIASGDGMRLGFDLVVLGLGAGLGLAAWHIARRPVVVPREHRVGEWSERRAV